MAKPLQVNIQSSVDVVSVRIDLRNYLLREVKCNLKTVVRAIVAITALGELIIIAQHRSPITVDFSVIEKEGEYYLKYSCELPDSHQQSNFSTRSLSNFDQVMDESGVEKTSHDALLVWGLLLMIM